MRYLRIHQVKKVFPLSSPRFPTQLPIIVVRWQSVVSSALDVERNQIHAETGFALEEPISYLRTIRTIRTNC